MLLEAQNDALCVYPKKQRFGVVWVLLVSDKYSTWAAEEMAKGRESSLNSPMAIIRVFGCFTQWVKGFS